MSEDKTTKEQEQIKMLKSMLKKPCAICNEKPVTVNRFVPANPVPFGTVTGEAVYFPVCRRCFDEGIDYDFLEATLAHCGIKPGAKPCVKLDADDDDNDIPL